MFALIYDFPDDRRLCRHFDQVEAKSCEDEGKVSRSFLKKYTNGHLKLYLQVYHKPIYSR